LLLGTVLIKDLRRWWSDRNGVVIAFMLPLLLTAVFGLSFGGFGGEGGISDIPVAIVGAPPRMLRQTLTDALEQTGFFTLVWTDSLSADRMVRTGEVTAALVLPPSFLESYFSGERVEVQLWRDVNSEIKAGIVEQILSRVLLDLRAGEATYYGAWSADWFPADGDPDPFAGLFADASVLDIYRRLRDGSADAISARERFDTLIDHQVALQDAFAVTGVDVEVRTKGEAAGGEPAADGQRQNVFEYFLPSLAVFFLMFGASAAAADVHRERSQGTLRRIFCTPMGARDLLLGKWLYSLISGICQLSLLLLLGRILFRVNLGPDPFTLPVMIICTAGALAAVFLPLALVTGSEKQMGQLGTGLVLGFAILGGSFIPIDFAPTFMRVLGRIAPNFWANQGFRKVVVYDRGIESIVIELSVLCGITVLFLGLGLLLLKRRGGREGLL